jgi:hypothetical protein
MASVDFGEMSILVKSQKVVAPLKNGVQPRLRQLKKMDSGLHRNDGKR